MRWLSSNSHSRDERSDVFPAPLAPHTRMVARLFTRNDRIPAVLGLTVPLAMSLLSVHGLSECFLSATAFPMGLSGYPMTVALASNPTIPVSSTGLDLQNLSPLWRFRMLIRLSTSRSSAIRLVEHLMWEFRPSIPFTVTWILLRWHGASTYTSSMWGSESSVSNIPAPTEWRYDMAHTSFTTASMSSVPVASCNSSHLSVRIERVIPMTESLSRLPPTVRYVSRMSSITSMTTAFSPSG